MSSAPCEQPHTSLSESNNPKKEKTLNCEHTLIKSMQMSVDVSTQEYSGRFLVPAHLTCKQNKTTRPPFPQQTHKEPNHPPTRYKHPIHTKAKQIPNNINSYRAPNPNKHQTLKTKTRILLVPFFFKNPFFFLFCLDFLSFCCSLLLSYTRGISQICLFFFFSPKNPPILWRHVGTYLLFLVHRKDDGFIIIVSNLIVCHMKLP